MPNIEKFLFYFFSNDDLMNSLLLFILLTIITLYFSLWEKGYKNKWYMFKFMWIRAVPFLTVIYYLFNRIIIKG